LSELESDFGGLIGIVLLEHNRFVGVGEAGVDSVILPELPDGQKRDVQCRDDTHVVDGEPERFPAMVGAYHREVPNGGTTVIRPIDAFDDI